PIGERSELISGNPALLDSLEQMMSSAGGRSCRRILGILSVAVEAADDGFANDGLFRRISGCNHAFCQARQFFSCQAPFRIELVSKADNPHLFLWIESLYFLDDFTRGHNYVVTNRMLWTQGGQLFGTSPLCGWDSRLSTASRADPRSTPRSCPRPGQKRRRPSAADPRVGKRADPPKPPEGFVGGASIHPPGSGSATRPLPDSGRLRQRGPARRSSPSSPAA